MTYSRSVAVAVVAGGIFVSMAGPASAAEHPSIEIVNGTLVVTGTAQGEQIGLQVPATDLSVLRVNVNNAVRVVQRSAFDRILVNGLAGNDIIGVERQAGAAADRDRRRSQ